MVSMSNRYKDIEKGITGSRESSAADGRVVRWTWIMNSIYFFKVWHLSCFPFVGLPCCTAYLTNIFKVLLMLLNIILVWIQDDTTTTCVWKNVNKTYLRSYHGYDLPPPRANGRGSESARDHYRLRPEVEQYINKGPDSSTTH